MRTNSKKSQRQRGATLIYAAFGTVALSGFVSLAVDWGRVQVAKTQLQHAADAAARYAASGLQNQINNASAAKDNAAASIADNKVEYRAISFDKTQDVELGIWTKATKKFVATTNVSSANAVRVTLRATTARNAAIPLMFMSALGRRSVDVTVSSIAAVDFSLVANGAGNGTYEYYIPATSNPWLAGAPSGTIANDDNPHNNPDYAGTQFTDAGTSKDDGVNSGSSGSGSSTIAGSNTQNWSNWGDYSAKKASPIKAGGITITPGTAITFDGVNGGANNMNSTTTYDGDGNTGQIESNYNGSENGIANVSAPINSVIGVFLNAQSPINKTPPSSLDFSTTGSRDYSTLSPALRQPFFIGDGRRSTGEVQQIVVPAGATRLFIGTMDGYEWNNNVGGFNVTAHVAGKITTVRAKP